MTSLKPDKKLSDRERNILKHVIEDYIKTAMPVPSQRLKKRYGIPLSASSIRNTLHELEAIGLLGHLHTSSGRVPNDEGYRLYVDKLMSLENYSVEKEENILQEFSDVISNVDILLQITADYLAQVSLLFGFVCIPYYKNGRLTDLELIPLSSGRLLFILGFDTGNVKSIVIDVSMDMKESILDKVLFTLRERLLGLSISEIQETIAHRLENKEITETELVQLIIRNVDSYFTIDVQNQIHTSSKGLLLKSPEFVHASEIQTIISILDDGDILLNEFSEGQEVFGIRSFIGKENRVPGLHHCSVVMGDFLYETSKVQLGVIGPTRMDYKQIFSTLSIVTKTIQRILNG